MLYIKLSLICFLASLSALVHSNIHIKLVKDNSFQVKNYFSQEAPFTYNVLDKAEKNWKVCAVLPNKADSYWKIVEAGLQYEAEKTGITLLAISSKNYSSIEQQKLLIRKRCIANGYQAIILGAVTVGDTGGISDVIKEAVDNNIPVVDLVNGISAPNIAAHARVDFSEMAKDAARQILTNNRHSETPINVLWFPGPKGPKWSEAGDQAFQEVVSQSKINIINTFYTPPFYREQLRTLKSSLKFMSDVQYIIGTAPTVEAGLDLRNELTKTQTKLSAYYFNLKLVKGMLCGHIQSASYDYPDLQARISIDQAVRILEGKPYHKEVGPIIGPINSSNVKDLFE